MVQSDSYTSFTGPRLTVPKLCSNTTFRSQELDYVSHIPREMLTTATRVSRAMSLPWSVATLVSAIAEVFTSLTYQQEAN